MDNPLIINRLERLKDRFEELKEELSKGDVINDIQKYTKLTKEFKLLEPIVVEFDRYKRMIKELEEAKDILINGDDYELKEIAKLEINELEKEIIKSEEKLRYLLVPKDPVDEKNAIVEIRAGTGGDEAALFAGDLFRMYYRFCERKNWKVEVNRYTEGTVGGYKEIVFKVIGHGAYGVLKFEGGVHRVQRIPLTETQGRIHTSAASVVVLPEPSEIEVVIDPKDIKKETFCASGPGGQSVNTAYSAVRLTHIPTGIVVTCQDERSQTRNLEKAMNELRARIYNLQYQKFLEEITKKRRTMISTGDRSVKIRTYNFPQNRVTDHRINFTIYNLEAIMDGELDELINQLQMAENAEKLKSGEIL